MHLRPVSHLAVSVRTKAGLAPLQSSWHTIQLCRRVKRIHFATSMPNMLFPDHDTKFMDAGDQGA